MKIALAQINCVIGDFEGNYSKIKANIQEAEAKGADIVVFPELSVCGYPARDFLEFKDFIDRCLDVVDRVAELSHNIAIIVGSPSRNPVPEGKDLFNSAFFLYQGKIQHVVNKALLPTYDIFDEYRYFEPGQECNGIEFKGKKIALTICEDIWNIGNENPLYRTCPMDVLIEQQPNFMINISASPFTHKKPDERIDIIRENVTRYGIPMFYCNYVGAQTEIIFEGGSIVANSKGVIAAELPLFKESLNLFDVDEIDAVDQDQHKDVDKIVLMHDAIVLGINLILNRCAKT